MLIMALLYILILKLVFHPGLLKAALAVLFCFFSSFFFFFFFSFFTYIKYIDKSAVAFCYHDCYVRRRGKERRTLS